MSLTSRRAPLPLLLALAALALAGCDVRFPKAPVALVRIDPDEIHQTIDGLGGSAADESALRAMPEPDRTAVMDLVFGDLEPSVVRLKVRPAIEPTNDDADPATVNPAGFVRPDDHLWQLDQIFARGNPKTMAAMWTPPAWMKRNNSEIMGSLKAGMAPELAELFSVYLGYLEAEGHPLDWLSIQNEPESPSPWDSCTYSPLPLADTAETIAQRIVADGHATHLVAPDTALVNFAPSYFAPILTKPTVTSLLDALAFHLYAQDYYDTGRIPGDIDWLRASVPAGTRLWMTEYSNTTGIGYGTWDEGIAQAERMHETLASGASMYLMWNLYRPGGPGEALIVIPTTPGTAGYTVTPKYWTARQFIKYVRPGARRIGASSDDADVLVTAYRDDAAGTIVAVFVNRAAGARWALVEGGALGDDATVVRSSEGEEGVVIPDVAPERFGPRGLHLSARSVTTVVWPSGG